MAGRILIGILADCANHPCAIECVCHKALLLPSGTAAISCASASPAFICLDTYMLCGVYAKHGVYLRNHCGAEPPRDIEPPGLVPTVGGRDRAPASYVAAGRVKAPARAARRRFRRIHGGRSAPSLPAEARTTSRDGCLASPVPPVLVQPPGCSRTPPRS